MQFFILLIASVILLAIVLLSLGLKSLIGRKKTNRLPSCRLSGSEEPGCWCSNTEYCNNK